MKQAETARFFQRIVEGQEQSQLDIPSAMAEIQSKTMEEIEAETALTWASRAVACYRLVIQTPDQPSRILRFSQANDFAHEALEHAAQADSQGKLLRYVAREIEFAKKQAFDFARKPDR